MRIPVATIADAAFYDTAEVPPGVEMEKSHEKHDGQEDDDASKHDFAAEGVALAREALRWSIHGEGDVE